MQKCVPPGGGADPKLSAEVNSALKRNVCGEVGRCLHTATPAHLTARLLRQLAACPGCLPRLLARRPAVFLRTPSCAAAVRGLSCSTCLPAPHPAAHSRRPAPPTAPLPAEEGGQGGRREFRQGWLQWDYRMWAHCPAAFPPPAPLPPPPPSPGCLGGLALGGLALGGSVPLGAASSLAACCGHGCVLRSKPKPVLKDSFGFGQHGLL